jgi:hypothetical protein
MAERHVTAALRRKYAELKGILKFRPEMDAEPTLEALRHVAAVLRMFAPAEDLAAIKPVRPYKPDRSLWTRSALDMLRTADRPLTAREIALRLIAAGVGERADLSSIECSLHASLARIEGRGLERLEGAPKRWRVALAKTEPNFRLERI